MLNNKNNKKTRSILFLDIHGFSDFSAEAQAIYCTKVLSKLKKIIDKFKPDYINTYGDAIVLTFISAYSAAQCALGLRNHLRELNTYEMGIPYVIEARIALHIADIIIGKNPLLDKEEIIGPGVNIASQLEPITNPGQIWSTTTFIETLQGSISDNDPIQFTESYNIELPKNFGEKKVHAIYQRGEDPPKLIEDSSKLVTLPSVLKNNASWMIVFIGDRQLEILHRFEQEIRRIKNKKVDSGLSYWGLAPAYNWTYACLDADYFMSDSTNRFIRTIKDIKVPDVLNGGLYNYISLGVGDGRKDTAVMAHLLDSQKHPDMWYFPVDMSSEMLSITVDDINRSNTCQNHLAIQRDFDDDGGLRDLIYVARQRSIGKALLFGFLGNTVCNLENPIQMLRRLSNNINPDNDMVLLEVWIIHEKEISTQGIKDALINGYSSTKFRWFATSSLVQNTDLTIDRTDSSQYSITVEEEELNINGENVTSLMVRSWYTNNTKSRIKVNLVNGEYFDFEPGDSIRIYQSRRFTPNNLKKIITETGFKIIKHKYSFDKNGLGFSIMLLKKIINKINKT